MSKYEWYVPKRLEEPEVQHLCVRSVVGIERLQVFNAQGVAGVEITSAYSLCITRIKTKQALSKPVLWVRIGFDADPDPACYLNADPDPVPGSQTNVDLCGSGSGSDFKLRHKKLRRNSLDAFLGRERDL
jgi:hypothetical protein